TAISSASLRSLLSSTTLTLGNGFRAQLSFSLQCARPQTTRAVHKSNAMDPGGPCRALAQPLLHYWPFGMTLSAWDSALRFGFPIHELTLRCDELSTSPSMPTGTSSLTMAGRLPATSLFPR